jgi:hypothetical protein
MNSHILHTGYQQAAKHQFEPVAPAWRSLQE